MLMSFIQQTFTRGLWHQMMLTPALQKRWAHQCCPDCSEAHREVLRTSERGAELRGGRGLELWSEGSIPLHCYPCLPSPSSSDPSGPVLSPLALPLWWIRDRIGPWQLHFHLPCLALGSCLCARLAAFLSAG